MTGQPIEAGPPHVARAAATGVLRAAGIDSPEYDAAALLAFALQLPVQRLPLAGELTGGQAAAYADLVARRAEREPLQYILGTAAFRHLELAVGPGVFIPRPETELLVQLAVDECGPLDRARVVDLCSGSGAIALAIATEVPHAQVTAVELDPAALPWLRRNVAAIAPPVEVVEGDATDPTLPIAPGVDVITCNPPYVPRRTPVSAEVYRDPAVAVFSGADGLDVIRKLTGQLRRLLRPGGVAIIEHDESHQDQVIDLFTRAGFTHVTGHRDLTHRPRYITAHHP